MVNSATNTTSTLNICTLDKTSTNIVNWLRLINMLINTVIINNILTGLMIASIMKSRKKVISLNNGQHAESNAHQQNRASKDRKFAVNAIMLNVAGLIFRLPLVLILVVTLYVYTSSDEYDMLYYTGVAIYAIDNSSTFFINYFFNSLFHDECLVILGLKKQSKYVSESITHKTTNKSYKVQSSS